MLTYACTHVYVYMYLSCAIDITTQPQRTEPLVSDCTVSAATPPLRMIMHACSSVKLQTSNFHFIFMRNIKRQVSPPHAILEARGLYSSSFEEL